MLFIAAVVKHDRSTDAPTAVAENGRVVRPPHAVVLKVLVEGLDAHRLDALVDEVADRVVHHRRRDGRVHLEAVGHVGGDVELATADVNVHRRCLAHGEHAGVEAVHQCPNPADVEHPGAGRQDRFALQGKVQSGDIDANVCQANVFQNLPLRISLTISVIFQDWNWRGNVCIRGTAKFVFS